MHARNSSKAGSFSTTSGTRACSEMFSARFSSRASAVSARRAHARRGLYHVYWKLAAPRHPCQRYPPALPPRTIASRLQCDGAGTSHRHPPAGVEGLRRRRPRPYDLTAVNSPWFAQCLSDLSGPIRFTADASMRIATPNCSVRFLSVFDASHGGHSVIRESRAPGLLPTAGYLALRRIRHPGIVTGPSSRSTPALYCREVAASCCGHAAGVRGTESAGGKNAVRGCFRARGRSCSI